jgi:hypothetical protein
MKRAELGKTYDGNLVFILQDRLKLSINLYKKASTYTDVKFTVQIKEKNDFMQNTR